MVRLLIFYVNVLLVVLRVVELFEIVILFIFDSWLILKILFVIIFFVIFWFVFVIVIFCVYVVKEFVKREVGLEVIVLVVVKVVWIFIFVGGVGLVIDWINWKFLLVCKEFLL